MERVQWKSLFTLHNGQYHVIIISQSNGYYLISCYTNLGFAHLLITCKVIAVCHADMTLDELQTSFAVLVAPKLRLMTLY